MIANQSFQGNILSPTATVYGVLALCAWHCAKHLYQGVNVDH